MIELFCPDKFILLTRAARNSVTVILLSSDHHCSLETGTPPPLPLSVISQETMEVQYNPRQQFILFTRSHYQRQYCIYKGVPVLCGKLSKIFTSVGENHNKFSNLLSLLCCYYYWVKSGILTPSVKTKDKSVRIRTVSPPRISDLYDRKLSCKM